jgi:hypothetical protein
MYGSATNCVGSPWLTACNVANLDILASTVIGAMRPVRGFMNRRGHMILGYFLWHTKFDHVFCDTIG